MHLNQSFTMDSSYRLLKMCLLYQSSIKVSNLNGQNVGMDKSLYLYPAQKNKLSRLVVNSGYFHHRQKEKTLYKDHFFKLKCSSLKV